MGVLAARGPSLIGFGDEDKFVVNNQARNVPEGETGQIVFIYSSFLGNDPFFQPFGMQKFEWDPVAQELEEARHNSLFSGVHLDHEERIIYGNPFGKLRIDAN
jgi:hypothetical protein